jgi:hypothetical protein
LNRQRTYETGLVRPPFCLVMAVGNFAPGAKCLHVSAVRPLVQLNRQTGNVTSDAHGARFPLGSFQVIIGEIAHRVATPKVADTALTPITNPRTGYDIKRLDCFAL